MSTVKSQPRERKTESHERRKKQGTRMRGSVNTGCLWVVMDFPVALKFSIMNANSIYLKILYPFCMFLKMESTEVFTPSTSFASFLL